MKILPVSLQTFKSKPDKQYNKYDLHYLYTMSDTNNKSYAKHYMATTLTAALIAVGVMLFNISGRRRFPYSIAELNDMSKGLNKIKTNEKLINTLKTEFIHPIKSVAMGDKSMKKSKDFKCGLVLTGEKSDELQNITEALTEHFKELDIRAVEIPHIISRVKDGEVIERKYQRSKLNKILLNEINNYAAMYKQDGKYTVINIGNMDDLADLKIVKSQNSNFEELLQQLSTDAENHGIIWVGWTDKQKAIPLFLSYLPVLIKKTV